MLKRIFGPKRVQLTAEWNKLHIEDLSYLYTSQNIFLWIKSRRKIWAGHVTRMGERRVEYRVMVGDCRGKGTFVE